MKHSTKRRCTFFLVLMMLLFSIITVLTGCAEEDSTKAVYQSNIEVKDQTPEFYVNDYGNIFSNNQKAEIQKRAVALNEDYNGIQLVLTTLESLEGNSVEKYATAMYNKFGIGKKDMGVLILFSSGDRKVRREVGRGMEAYMTDADAGSLLDDYAIDYFKKDQFAEGLINLQKAVITFIEDKVPIDWNSDSEAVQSSENDSKDAQVAEESANVVQTTDNTNVKDSETASEKKSDSGIPFIFWMTGIGNWVISVLIGCTAGPLWGATHLGTSQDRGSRAVYGYIYLIDSMIRPPIMVFGFFFASVAIIAIGTILNFLFGAALTNVQISSFTGIFSLAGFLLLYARSCTTIVAAAFALQAYLPDHVINFLGGRDGVNTLGNMAGSIKEIFAGSNRNIRHSPNIREEQIKRMNNDNNKDGIKG